MQASLFDALASENAAAKRMLNSRETPDKYKDNLLKVVLYFEEFNYESIAESPAYEVRVARLQGQSPAHEVRVASLRGESVPPNITRSSAVPC